MTRAIAHHDGRLGGRGDAIAERDALLVLEAVGEQPRHHVGVGLGRMPRDPEAEIVVDAAVDVGQLHREGVHRRAEGHSGRA